MRIPCGMRCVMLYGLRFVPELDRPVEWRADTMFVAPREVQQEARRRGIDAIMMRRAPGLMRALGFVEAPMVEVVSSGD